MECKMPLNATILAGETITVLAITVLINCNFNRLQLDEFFLLLITRLTDE